MYTLKKISKKSFIFKALFIILALLIVPNLSNANICVEIIEIFKDVLNNPNYSETTLESELSIESALKLIEPNPLMEYRFDNAVSSLSAVIAWKEKNNLQFIGDKKTWKTLPDSLKLAMYNEIARQRRNEGTSFYVDRSNPFFILKKEVEITISEHKVIFGKHYDPGTHVVKIPSRHFYVEYTSERFEGVELHFRTSEYKAGDLLEGLLHIYEGLRIEGLPFHQHIVGKEPAWKLLSPREATKQALVLAEFTRISEVFTHLLSVAQGLHLNQSRSNVPRTDVIGKLFKLQKSGRGNSFGFRDQSQAQSVITYFLNKSHGFKSHLGTIAKLMWVGVRGSDYYEGLRLWGEEFRSIMTNGNQNMKRIWKVLLNSVQEKIASQEYGVDVDHLLNWYETTADPMDSYQLIEKYRDNWYITDWKLLFENANPNLQDRVSGLKNWKIRKSLTLLSESVGQDIKMLVYDWTKDPLISAKPEIHGRIIWNQQKAIDKLKLGSPIEFVMIDFVIGSGLIQEYARALGVSEDQLGNLYKLYDIDMH